MTTTTDTSIQSLARQLAAKTPLDADTPPQDAARAVAFLIARAGTALSALRPGAGPTLDALLALDALTHPHASAATLWLAIRALGLKPGATVGVARDMLDNPIFAALIGASQLGVSADPKETAAGTIAATWPAAQLAPQARHIAFDATIMAISHKGAPLARVDVHADPRGALACIDALAVTQGPKTATPQPVAYTVHEAAALEQFSAEIFSPYQVRRITIPHAQPHTAELVESAALSSVLPPVPSYQPLLLPGVVSSGALSDVQIEAIIYAGEAHTKFLPAHPNDANLPAPRQAFLVGHGTGIGKGRILAGIMADNWAQNRRRHVWVSESADLITDARADWAAVGGNPEDVWDARDLPATQTLPAAPGILFLTYAALRAEAGMGRVAQIVEWMEAEDGVVAFDESQNLRNTVSSITTSGWTIDASCQGLAARDLQDNLPRARVVYSSATSASNILSLAYAYRLGLWGEGTAFADAPSFLAAMEEGGTNALEMVARDMKAMGLYLSANMSLHGVVMERIEHRMSAYERQMHDKMSVLWQEVADKLKRAIISTGIHTGPASAIKRVHKRPTFLFNQAKDRFFQATDAAMKTPLVIKKIQEDLKNGHASVVQIANTFEANATRAIQSAQEAGMDMDSVAVTPRDILAGYLNDAFPIHLWERVLTTKGGMQIVPKRDSAGQQMVCPQALAERNALLAQIDALSMPEGPLEQIIDAFGVDMVAEATGRSRRLVPGPTGRVLEKRPAKAMAQDIAAFQDGNKLVLCFSNAGSAGHTYSASRKAGNRRLRRHYILQIGARADTTIQAMGRTHRSDQAQPPEYILVSLDLWADRRMISRVARGMRDLGAITRGLRQAASQDFFTQEDNLEDEFGQEAWRNFVAKLHDGQIPGLSLGQFEREANLTIRLPGGGVPAPAHLPPVHRFLNGMSAMTCESQAAFGQVLRDELIELRAQAIANGTYDRGIETIRPDALIKLEDMVIHRDARTGGETRLLKMLRVDHLSPVSFQDARQEAIMRGSATLAKSLLTGRVAIVSFPKGAPSAATKATDRVRVYTPNGVRERTRAEVVGEGWTPLDAAEALRLWQAESDARGMEEERTFWVATGTLLPIWDKLPKGRATVYRMETDEGEQIIGRIVDDAFVDKLRRRMDALSTGGLDADTVIHALYNKGMVQMANGWTLQGRTSKGVFQGSILYLPQSEDGAMRRLRTQGFEPARSWRHEEVAYRLPEDATPQGVQALLAQVPAVHIIAF